MVAVPIAAAVTMPEPVPATDALVLLLLHMPPATGSDNVIDAPEQKEEAPVIVPALGGGTMVIVVVTMALDAV